MAPIAPAAAQAGLRDEIPREVQDVHPKIDSRLEEEIQARPHERIPVIIMLNEQRVPFRVEAAKSLQAETQLQLLTSLNDIGADPITQHWITNAISATVYAPKIAGIAARPDVEKIWLDEEIGLPEPPDLPELYPEPPVDDAITRLLIGADRPAAANVAQAGEDGGVISGTVTDIAGYPVPGARVLGRKQLMGVAYDVLSVTAADGSFATPVLAPGMYEIIIHPARYVPLTPVWVPNIAVIEGETTTKDVTLYWDYGDPIINAPPMWAAGYDGAGIKIAILDTGIDHTHPDLTGRVIAAKDFTDDDTVMDWDRHGTHAAGIAAGAYNPDWAISGVAPGAYLLNARIFNRWRLSRTSWILRAIEWSMDQGAHILNMSFGGRQMDGTGRMPICRASANAVTAGHIVVTAAGNEGPGEATILSPAIAHDVIAVAGSGARDGIIWFSSRGTAGDGRVALDIAAPGLWVIAPVPLHLAAEFPGYDDLSGTSMSAPHVAGAAALLLDAFPGLTPTEVEMALKSTADDLGIGILDQGAGRLNVKAAFLALREGILAKPHEWSVGRVLPGNFTQIFTVINNAAEARNLDITRSIMTDTQDAVAGDWITVPASITVAAGATAAFDAAMTVPAATAPGTYFGYVKVGDITIPVSVNVIQPVDHLTVVDITGTVDEGANLFGWGDHVYYTLDVQPDVTNLTLRLSWGNVTNDLNLALFNPLGELTAESGYDHPVVISVDSPMPGEWTVLMIAKRIEPRTVETYALRVDATAGAAGAITFTVNPVDVVRHQNATFNVTFTNIGGVALDVVGVIDIYYLGEYGRGFPVMWSRLGKLSIAAGEAHTWTITERLPMIPGSHEATARLFYGDEIITEKVVPFTILPSGTGTFTGVVSCASTGDPIAGATVEAIDPVTDKEIGTAITDPYGTYELVVYEGTYEFRVSAEGFVELHQEMDVVVDAGVVETLDFKLWGRVIIYPAPPARTNVPTQIIRGTSEEEATVAIAAVPDDVVIGEVTYPTLDTWVVEVTLVEGTNTITATATIDDVVIGTATAIIVLDTTPPVILETVPAADAAGVPIDTNIAVTFSEPMDTASAADAFSIVPEAAGSFSWAHNILTFDPAVGLEYDTTYTITIGTAAMDLAGNPMAEPYICSFTTLTGDLRELIAETPAGDTLKLGPGIFSGDVTIDKPITITGVPGETVIHGGIRISPLAGSDVTIENLIITDYTEFGIRIEEVKADDIFIIRNNEIRGVAESQVGIKIDKVDAGGGLTIEQNIITGNETAGIKLLAAVEAATIELNNITGNTVGLELVAAGTADAAKNWWGDISGPGHAVFNPGGSGNQVVGTAGFQPWLTRDFQTVIVDNIGYFGFAWVELAKGWNILSTPFALDPAADTWGEFVALGDGLDIHPHSPAWRFDAGTQIWERITADYLLQPCDAIYVRMASADKAAILVSPERSVPSRRLYAGWNLIGLSAMENMKANEALISVAEVPEGLTGYVQVVSPPVGYQLPWIYLAGQDEPIPYMEITKGYWIFMLNEGTLAGFVFTPLPLTR